VIRDNQVQARANDNGVLTETMKIQAESVQLSW